MRVFMFLRFFVMIKLYLLKIVRSMIFIVVEYKVVLVIIVFVFRYIDNKEKNSYMNICEKL